MEEVGLLIQHLKPNTEDTLEIDQEEPGPWKLNEYIQSIGTAF